MAKFHVYKTYSSFFNALFCVFHPLDYFGLDISLLSSSSLILFSAMSNPLLKFIIHWILNIGYCKFFSQISKPLKFSFSFNSLNSLIIAILNSRSDNAIIWIPFDFYYMSASENVSEYVLSLHAYFRWENLLLFWAGSSRLRAVESLNHFNSIKNLYDLMMGFSPFSPLFLVCIPLRLQQKAWYIY